MAEMGWTPEELRLLAASDTITEWDDDLANRTRVREAMAKARAGKAAKRVLRAAQDEDRRRRVREATLARIAVVRAQDEARRQARWHQTMAKPADTRLTWADRTILARLPATLDDLDRRFQDLKATKVPREIHDRLQRLEQLGMAVRAEAPTGSVGVSVARWTRLPDGLTTASDPKRQADDEDVLIGLS